MQLPLTLFADDHLGHWMLRTIENVMTMESFILRLFSLLESYGMKVNPEKSSVVIRVQGTQLRKLMKKRTVMIKNKPHWRLKEGNTEHLIPMREDIAYLGKMLSLKEGSDKTLEFRIAEATAKAASLRKSIRSRKGLSQHHRVRIWHTCVVSSAMYGLLTTHLNGRMIAKLRAWFHRQLRAVAGPLIAGSLSVS